ncbi:hypothetical protein K435DRAFT_842050, partial [Dendrothele bispora CBS 962.96]
MTSFTDISRASVILDADSENPKSCDLVLRGTGETMYEVRTENAFTLTSFRRAGEVTAFAVFERRDLLPNTITLTESYGSQRTTKTLKLVKWLKSPRFSSWPVELEVRGNKYVWKETDDKSRLLLYQNSTAMQAGTSPIGWFERGKRELQDNGPGVAFEWKVTNPCIVILPSAEEIVNEIVVSALLLEQKDRWLRGRPSTALVFVWY